MFSVLELQTQTPRLARKKFCILMKILNHDENQNGPAQFVAMVRRGIKVISFVSEHGTARLVLAVKNISDNKIPIDIGRKIVYNLVDRLRRGLFPERPTDKGRFEEAGDALINP